MMNEKCMFLKKLPYGQHSCYATTKASCENCSFYKEGDYKEFLEEANAECKRYEEKKNNRQPKPQKPVTQDASCMFWDSEIKKCRALTLQGKVDCTGCHFYKKGTKEDYIKQISGCITRENYNYRKGENHEGL